jgi:membrane-bound inhibitor of C-type lysozyme
MVILWAMVTDARLMICLIAALVLVACTKPATRKYAYSCPDGYEFTIAYSDQGDAGDVAAFEDTSGTLLLPRTPAASGERYSNDSTVFWSKGDEAMIEKSGAMQHQNCTT